MTAARLVHGADVSDNAGHILIEGRVASERASWGVQMASESYFGKDAQNLTVSEGAILASLEGGAIVDEKSFAGNLVFLRARGPASLLDRYRRFREKQDPSSAHLPAKQTARSTSGS